MLTPKGQYVKSQPSKSCSSPSFYHIEMLQYATTRILHEIESLPMSHWKGFEIQTLNIGFCLGTDERNNDNADR